ncbi:MAG: LPS export ABC transporter periplasmic protein LptC [Desulfatitalea sp.]|nr:LPS export ABC transporter periplasmic protein LptC [Desulfatitalea sp.]MBI5895342.1 LPS export ABC transporter periplasmic protein LptC [Desulfobacterales bacterium]
MADRKHLIKYLLIGVLLVIVTTVAVRFVHFRQQQGHPLPTADQIATDALMTLVNIHQTATKEGKVQWELDADSAQLEAENGRMILTGPRVDFITRDGGKVRLTARKGVLHTRSSDMAARGQVRLRNDQYELESESLKYQHKERLLSSQTQVRIIGPAFDLRADRMTYNLEENRAYFEGRVEGNLNAGFAF